MKEMIKNKEKGFTLIELLAVIVVLAVLALIAVPIVLNIINKANKQSEERSIESYVRAIDYAISECMMVNPRLKKKNIIIDNYEVKISSTNEVCAKIDVSKGTEITGCTYEVSDNEKGYNLIGCNIKGNYYNYVDGKVVSVENTENQEQTTYTEYNIGDEILFIVMKFYVIAPSDTKQDYVTLLKDEPLTVDEVNTYGAEKANDRNGYGEMAYYTSATCRDVDGEITGCTTNYKESDIKYVVDAWTNDKLAQSDLKEVDEYKVRLITYEELTTNLGYISQGSTIPPSSNGETPSWLYNINYGYWTMSTNNDSTYNVWFVDSSGNLVGSYLVYTRYEGVRPVINLLKSAI